MLPDFRFMEVIKRPPPAEMIGKMAAELLRLEAVGSEADMIRALLGKYPYGEIIAFGDQAMALARQLKGMR
jgi:hypothetical protein